MAYNKSDAKGILVIILKDNEGAIEPAAAEALGKGRELADTLGCELVAACLGMCSAENKPQIAAADRVITAQDEQLVNFSTENYVETLLPQIEAEKYEAILIAATADGRELAPYLAAALGVDLTSDCMEISIDGGTWTAKRPCFGGNLFATIEFTDTRPLVFTTKPKAFTPYQGEEKAREASKIAPIPVDGKRVTGYTPDSGTANLGDADVIVSGGRGMGSPESFQMLFDLANALEGAVGASRAAVDAEWIPYPHQVGQTGKTVRPKIYIAFGISGAIQHLAGMRSSDVIIAVNRDKDASIFKVANYGVVTDAIKAIPALIEKLKSN